MKEKFTFRQLFRENIYFFVLYIIFLSAGAVILLSNEKGDVLLFLNENHTQYFDIFFKYITWLGDGIFVAILLIPLALIKIRHAIFTFTGYAITGIISQLIKHTFNEPRPSVVFRHLDLHFVKGVDILSSNSFPSGHTVSAFSLFFLLSIFTKNKAWGIVFFLLALSVGLSRVYLSLHFFVDIYFGSIIGVFFTVIIYIAIANLNKMRSPGTIQNSLLEAPFFRKITGS